MKACFIQNGSQFNRIVRNLKVNTASSALTRNEHGN